MRVGLDFWESVLFVQAKFHQVWVGASTEVIVSVISRYTWFFVLQQPDGRKVVLIER